MHRNLQWRNTGKRREKVLFQTRRRDLRICFLCFSLQGFGLQVVLCGLFKGLSALLGFLDYCACNKNGEGQGAET